MTGVYVGFFAANFSTFWTFNQTAPLGRRSRLNHLYSFDLSLATERFPLTFQEVVVKGLFGKGVSLAGVFSRLGRKMFQPPSNSRKGTMSALIVDSPFGTSRLGLCAPYATTFLCGVLRRMYILGVLSSSIMLSSVTISSSGIRR